MTCGYCGCSDDREYYHSWESVTDEDHTVHYGDQQVAPTEQYCEG